MSDQPLSDADVAEAKRRAKWLHKHKAPKNWIILTVFEVSTIREKIMTLERELNDARAENKILREALLRVRTWGVNSKNFCCIDGDKMSAWIDSGCVGELPEPHGPWIYARMEAAK